MKALRNGKVKVSAPERAATAESKLLWQQYVAPAMQALQMHQQAVGLTQHMVAERMAIRDGIDLHDGWRLDADRLVWVKVPVDATPR